MTTRGLSRRVPPPRGEAGFSLIEILMTLLVMTLVMVAILTLLDTSNKVTRSQNFIAEMQNNHRVAQQELVKVIEMSGVGGLPEGIDPANALTNATGVFPNGLALAVANNVPEDTHVGDDTTPLVVEETDVLTLRGVFTTPVYFIEPQVPVTLDGSGRMSLVLNTAVDTGVNQDLEPLRQELVDALAASPARKEALVVRDRYNPGTFGVFELDPGNTTPGNTGDPTLTIGLILRTSGTGYADQYGRMTLGTTLLQGAGGTTATLPDGTVVQLPRVIGTVGLLEEYRFYIRQEWEVSGDAATRPTPVLSRARFYPNTPDLHPDGSIDLADNIVDLQVALGVDLPPLDGQVVDLGDATDEVLYNHPDDDDDLMPQPSPTPWGAWGVADAQLRFVRLNLVSQAPRPDRDFEGVILGRIEDHDHAPSAGDPSIFNTGPNPKVRKRLLQTVVDARNLP